MVHQASSTAFVFKEVGSSSVCAVSAGTHSMLATLALSSRAMPTPDEHKQVTATGLSLKAWKEAQQSATLKF